MNSKIIKISYDQNTIAHESGFESVSVDAPMDFPCRHCAYYYTDVYYGNCSKVPCTKRRRKDKKSVIFIAKPK